MDDDGVPTVTKFAARKAKQTVDLVFSIKLTESMFEYNHNGETSTSVDELDDGNDDEDIEEDLIDDGDDDKEVPVAFAEEIPNTLLAVSKRCSRLIALLSTLESLKFSGMSQSVTMDMVLHLLRLVTATVTYEGAKAVLCFENVGTVLHFGNAEVANARVPSGDLEYKVAPSEVELAEELAQEFALPAPSREVLLLAVINLLSNKGPLRSVSNSSIYTPDVLNRSLLVLQWKPLLRMVLRTAPYLDEHVMGQPVKDSNARTGAILKRTVQLIRDARHFFEQGVRPPGHESVETDQTAKAIWAMVKEDVLFHSHTHACYRGTILIYLFQPTRCSQDYYLSVLPHWWEAWTNIDRCPEYDFLWLALFCRARKHVSEYDWSPIRKRLLTHSQYWLQLPIGGAAMDTSFPRASNPRSRSCPQRLKVFAGTGSSYDEGIDFVAKVAKLLIAGLGTGKDIEVPDAPAVTEGTNDILLFLSFVTPYFNPSNLGQWTFTLGAFLHYFAYELCCRMGAASGNEALLKSHPAVVQALLKVQPGSHCSGIPAHEVVALMEALLPLCQQTLYSKNGHVGRAGEAAMLYLVQIDPGHTTPAFIDFACRALDISAVNLSHQAPAALSALTRLIQPALRSDPAILLSRLPELLRLSLAGIDSNDQNKTIRTLILYRSLTSWVPVGRCTKNWPAMNSQNHAMSDGDGTLRLGSGLYDTLAMSKRSNEYIAALERLPPSSLLKQGIFVDDIDHERQQILVEEATSAMSDWALEFLERVFGLLRASGEREKTSKRASGVASRHSSADVSHARNFSRVLRECMIQVFSAMDDETHQLAIRTVTKFFAEETLPTAAKDASLVCQAAAAPRSGNILNPGLDELVNLLTDNLSHQSTKTVTYRLRCLSGAVRSASHGVIKHRMPISAAIDFALLSDDRHLFKTGCKLLRHTLSALVESYPLSFDARPRSGSPSSTFGFGVSAQLHGDPVQWHVPNRESIELAHELLQLHVVQRLDSLCANISTDSNSSRSRLLNTVEVNNLRRCLRVVRYSIRGGASVLLDSTTKPSHGDDSIPYEKACYTVVDVVDDEIQNSLYAIRGRLCSFLVVLSSIIASETLYPDGLNELPESHPYRKVLPLISSDPKVCKETSDLSLLLLTRRGSAFRSQEARTIWKAQKQLASDFMLCAQVDHMSEFLLCASLYGDAETVLYKDGEDGGKTIPRRLLIARVQLFHDSLQRNASFEIPRRLRIVERNAKTMRNRLFSVKSNLPGMIGNLESVLLSSPSSALDAYEGIADGLYALCCHSNAQVRASSLSVIDYTMTRFGWLVAIRAPRLMAGLALEDHDMNGKFGIPSCSSLVDSVNQQGKRKKLAEAVKGVCSILSLSRAMKHVLQSERLRFQFAKTICGTDSLISLLPTEEMQKFVHYLQAVFSPFRSKIYSQLRITPTDKECHAATLRLALDILSEKTVEEVIPDSEESSSDGGAAVHWRKMLLACWFLLASIDETDLVENESIARRTWSTCFRIIETENGQPLQRVGLGLFGRLVHLVDEGGTPNLLQEKMSSESFCRAFAEALVYDHKEDSSVGGGHDAQWATGVEDIIRDAARNVAPRTLFPFQRTSQALGAFKPAHAQLVELVLSRLDKETATVASRHLLIFAKEIADAPPSEDQRNQQITSAEIFGGVCGSFLRRASNVYASEWDDVLLTHLDDVMEKTPFSLSGAYFDAIRYALQFCPPTSFFPLTRWLVERIRSTLWQPSLTSTSNVNQDDDQLLMSVNASYHGNEGFTAQSKWLYLFTAVLIEMDESEAGSTAREGHWYKKCLAADAIKAVVDVSAQDPDLEMSWQLVIDCLLPRLTAALAHPFDSCRDHISRTLFRICYCHQKMERMNASRELSHVSISPVAVEIKRSTIDPGLFVVKKLASLEKSDGMSFKDRYNALSTARRFIAYCVHLGEAKFEYSDYVIPLLRLSFEAIKSTVEEEITSETVRNQDENVAKRSLEAEVIKGYRCTIAEVSITAVIAYGRESDIGTVLDIAATASAHEKWQVRHAAMHFLRCFQGAHKFVFSSRNTAKTMQIVADVLADERREVCSAGMAALTGILAASPVKDVTEIVKKYILIAGVSKMRRPKKGANSKHGLPAGASFDGDDVKRLKDQKTSVFFLCAAIMAQPYETPQYVPAALAAISMHSFERNAPLGVRDTVKRCCADYKKTHMSDNWQLHRSAFSQEQLEALEDVVSTPHYYA